ncbi:MAG: hypothetical protein ACTSVZ_11960 [Promethearchaeota archaeon]
MPIIDFSPILDLLLGHVDHAVIIIAIIENPLDYLLDKHDWLKQKNIKKRIYISVSTTKIKSSLQIPRTFNTDSSNN